MIYGQYTVVLKTLLDNEQVKPLIDKALSTYPVYVPENPALFTVVPTREEINTKLLNHYKYREIGFETVGRFIDELEISMCEIMPYYNQLFKSEDILNAIDDIFGNIDITEEYSETVKGSAKGDTETTGTGTANTTMNNSGETNSETTSTSNSNTSMETTDTGKNIKSETPQNNLTITGSNIDSVNYADAVDWKKNENTSNSEGSESSTGSNTTTNTDESTSNSTTTQSSSGTSSSESESETKHTLHHKGNQGVNTYAHDMLEFRELFLNIVQQIIEDVRIKELFMNIY